MCRYQGKGGYSLLETMFALAIMSVGAAIIAPRISTSMDQIVAHTVFFDFQRQILDAKREAFRNQTDFALIDSDVRNEQPAPAASIQPLRLSLRSGWSYKMVTPMSIREGGLCSPGEVWLMNGGKPLVHLLAQQNDCRFIRVL